MDLAGLQAFSDELDGRTDRDDRDDLHRFGKDVASDDEAFTKVRKGSHVRSIIFYSDAITLDRGGNFTAWRPLPKQRHQLSRNLFQLFASFDHPAHGRRGIVRCLRRPSRRRFNYGRATATTAI